MRYFAAVICLLLMTISCTELSNQESTITGKAPEVLNGMRVYLQEADDLTGQLKFIDTAIVMNNEFDFGSQPSSNYNKERILSLDGSNGFLYFVSENGITELELNKDNLESSTVGAGKMNESYKDYLEKRSDFKNEYQKLNLEVRKARRESEQQFNQAIKNLEQGTDKFTDEIIDGIKENPSNPLGPIYLREIAQGNLITVKEAREAYNLLAVDLQNHPAAKRLDKFLSEKEIVAIGSKAPYFEGRNPDGSIIKLPETLDKVTLVDFWASWCGPCRKENPNIVDAYDKYHDKGFNVIGVSLDKPGEKEKWIAAIEQDSLDWNHISRLAYWNDPIAKKYQVRGIPASFLLDQNGIIIDKDLRGVALHKRLADLLN